MVAIGPRKSGTLENLVKDQGKINFDFKYRILNSFFLLADNKDFF